MASSSIDQSKSASVGRIRSGNCAIAVSKRTPRPHPARSGRTLARNANAAPTRMSMVISAEREPQNQMPAARKEISTLCMRSGKRNVSKAASANSRMKPNAFGFCEKPEIWKLTKCKSEDQPLRTRRVTPRSSATRLAATAAKVSSSMDQPRRAGARHDQCAGDRVGDQHQEAHGLVDQAPVVPAMGDPAMQRGQENDRAGRERKAVHVGDAPLRDRHLPAVPRRSRRATRRSATCSRARQRVTSLLDERKGDLRPADGERRPGLRRAPQAQAGHPRPPGQRARARRRPRGPGAGQPRAAQTDARPARRGADVPARPARTSCRPCSTTTGPT